MSSAATSSASASASASDSSVPSDMSRESDSLDQVDIDKSLYPIYHSIQKVIRGLEAMRGKGNTGPEDKHFRHLQDQLVDIETKHKKDGIWGGDLQAGNIPAGQAAVNELLERAHQIEEEIVDQGSS